jgi:YggT family protein
MYILADLIGTCIEIYIFIIILEIAVSWLTHFGVLNIQNPQARNLVALLKRATDPVMEPVRRVIPSIGGFDLSPLVVIIGLQILERIILRILY